MTVVSSKQHRFLKLSYLLLHLVFDSAAISVISLWNPDLTRCRFLSGPAALPRRAAPNRAPRRADCSGGRVQPAHAHKSGADRGEGCPGRPGRPRGKAGWAARGVVRAGAAAVPWGRVGSPRVVPIDRQLCPLAHCQRSAPHSPPSRSPA